MKSVTKDGRGEGRKRNELRHSAGAVTRSGRESRVAPLPAADAVRD